MQGKRGQDRPIHADPEDSANVVPPMARGRSRWRAWEPIVGIHRIESPGDPVSRKSGLLDAEISHDGRLGLPKVDAEFRFREDAEMPGDDRT